MPTILVADDNALSLKFLSDVIELLGISCRTAKDGITALKQACNSEFDLLLLDYRMPELNACEILSQLRSDPKNASALTPAIITSAEITQSQMTEWFAQGFCDVLEKPCAIGEITRLMQEHGPTAVMPPLGSSTLTPISTPTPWLDDGQGLRTVGGDAAILRSLRGLLIDELCILDSELHKIIAIRDWTALNERLHRLRASAGFCGVPGLQNAISEFWHIAQSNPSAINSAFHNFSAMCQQVRALLRTSHA